VTQGQVYSRVADLVDFRMDRDMNEELIPNKIRVILETAQKSGEMDNIPVRLKYWLIDDTYSHLSSGTWIRACSCGWTAWWIGCWGCGGLLP
jgi:hypothetical protein